LIQPRKRTTLSHYDVYALTQIAAESDRLTHVVMLRRCSATRTVFAKCHLSIPYGYVVSSFRKLARVMHRTGTESKLAQCHTEGGQRDVGTHEIPAGSLVDIR
jgi:hypothetical protein